LGILPIWVDAIRRDPEQASSLLADFLELRRALIGEILVVFPSLDSTEREAILQLVSDLASIVARTDEDFQLATTLDLKIVTALLTAKSNVAYILLFNTFRTLLQEIPELQRAMYFAPAQNALAYRAVFSLLESARSLDEVLRTVDSTVRAIDEVTVARFKEQLESV
jgi:DNA-binding FadR family transcriptional regulator